MRKKKRVLAAVFAAVLIICTVFAEADVTVAATSIDTSTSTDAVVQETDAMVQESEEQIVDETETDATVPETEDQIADETVDNVQETIESESETETQEIISEETEEETEEKTQEVIASYPWSDLDDEAFCAWVTGGEHDEKLKAMDEEHGQEYEAFQQRLEEITAQDVLQRIMQYIMNLNGSNESIATMNIETEAFNSMCQSIFGVDYAGFKSNTNYAEVYVGQNAGGEQTGDLGTQTKPYNTVNAAYSSLSSKSGVIIHLLESYGSVSEPITTWPDNPIPAIIVSDAYGTAVLNMSGLKWNFPANTGFYNVKINLAYSDNTTAAIFANGHHVVFGGKEENNFAFINNNETNRYYPTLFGASEQGTGTQSSHSSVENTHLEVYGGTWSQIFGGGEYYSDVDGTATVIVNGSYREDGTLKPGAVTFADTGLSYMEGSSHIYGGGAGVYTLLSKENYSNVQNTDVTISYITTSKYLTPCGGSVTASAKISLDYVNAMGVNARSEGSSASKVSIVIQNSTISEDVGALGGGDGGAKQAYKMVSDINDFDITIKNSTVRTLYVKSRALADGTYNNSVTGVDLCLEDSTFNEITLARLPANYESGTVNRLRLKNVSCNRYHAEANFREIKQIELIGIGTEAAPFKWENYTFGSTNYGNVNSVSESLLIENSYVNFGINYSTQSLALKGNSRVRLKQNLSMETGDFEGDAASQITLEDGSTVNISGDVTGTGITVDPVFSPENASAQILWSRGSNPTNLSYVSSDKADYRFTKDYTARMDIWKWYNYDPPVSEYSYVYVDGGLGYDTAEEYNSDQCTDANLGYDKLYPVKTFAKAYSLCKDSNYVIVLCGEYDLTVGETPVSLLGDAEAKDFPVRVQSTDDRNDYRSVAKLRFAGSTGNVTLSAPLIFDNMNLESSVANGNVRIFSNGNKTEYGAGVTVIRVGDKCSVEVYGGADGDNVASADLTVKAAYFDKIGAVGKDDTASVGDENNIVQTDIAKLTVSENSQGVSSVCYYGTTYGSVHTELSYAVGSKNIYNANSSNGTVYGDFYTEVSSGNDNKKNASVVPDGLTVKGKVSFVDRSGKTYYDSLSLKKGNFNEVYIYLSVKGIGSIERGKYVSLFDSNTKADHISWNISGKVPRIFGANDNAGIKAGTMAVDVVLNNTATTIVKACPEAAGNTVDSGYPENDKITVTLKDFAEGSYLDELWGFGSIAFDNSKILVNAEISAKNVTVDQGSVVVFANHAAIGSAPGTGKLTLQNGGSLEVRNQIAVNGDMCGGESADAAGTLIDNWADANDETVRITVTGKSTGYTYFSTDYASAEIQVMGDTLGHEYMAPKLPPELPPMKITCTPAAAASPAKERIWTVENPVSKKYIFVNGTIDSSASDYTSHNGSTPELALATLEEAYDTVLNNGYIVLCGDISLSSWPLNGTKSVTLTSKVTIGTGETARTYDFFSAAAAQPSFLVITDNLELKGVTTFEYLNIKADKNYVLGACGHKLVMGRQGDPDSLKMTNFPISVGGGGYNHAYSNINSDLTIHAGIYNIVSGGNSSDIINVYNKYSSVNITIDGGTFQSVYAKYNLYDDFSAANEISLSICKAKVENTISAIKTNYTMGNAYQVNIGENMKFGEACYIRTSATTINYTPNPAPNITFKIDGGTGTRYRIPTIYGGPGVYNGNNTMNETVTVDLKNVEVGTFICGSSNQTLQKKSNGSMELVLNENVHVSKLYLGGSMLAGASAKVFVKSDQATIDKLRSGSEFSASTPVTCELTYSTVGTDSEHPYVLSGDVCLDGLTKLILKNAVVDFSQAGNSITVGEINASEGGSIIHKGRNLTLNADYTAGTSDEPTMWYGQNAPRIVINGTVSGTTHLQSLSADPSAEDGSVTGKFYNGISVTASHSDTHSANNFFGLQSSEGAKPEWKELKFTAGTDTDTWKKSDEGDTDARIQVYVSSEGSDSNSGAFPTPVKTLAQAYKNADRLHKDAPSKTKIEIILLDDIVHNGELPASAELSNGFSVLVKSYDAASASTLTIDSDPELPVDTTLDNIIIKSTVTTGSCAIFANGNTLTCTENLKVEAVNGHYPVIYGGTKDATVLDQTNLQIFGGTWSRIFGGSKTASVTTANLSVGGNVDTKNVGSIAENDTGVFGGGENGTVGTVNLSIDGGSFYRVLGGGLNPAAVVQGNITVDFNHGTIDRLYGGGQWAQTNGNITVNIGGSNAEAMITSIFRGSGLYAGVAEGQKATTNVMDGAIIKEGVQFAAGGYSGNLDETELNISGGSINCNVFAGGWGEGTNGAYGIVGEKAAVTITGGTITGNVYGGGNLALVHNNADNAAALVTVKGGAITGNVYGGGYSAGVDNTNVTIRSNVKGSVFGGGYDITADKLQVQKSSTVTLERGTVEESVFGGSDTAGLISDSVSVTIAGDVTVKNGVFGGGSKAALQITPDVKVNKNKTLTGSIYGGGKGAVNGAVGAIQNGMMSFFALFSAEKSYTIDGLTDANVPSTNVIIEGTVTGDVFGGGEMATVGKEDSTTWNKTVTNVTLENGASVDGNIYGGGKGQSEKDYAVVYGCTSVSLNGGTVKADQDDEKAVAGAVFGGGQIAPVAGSTNVIVNGGTISNIFGGNDVEGEVNQTTNVTVPENSTATVTHIYGGGRNAAHNRNSESDKANNVTINGGSITQIYGGGYGAAAVSGDTDVTIAGGIVTEVFGGGNAAKTKKASVTITGGRIDTAYAGGNAATVTGTDEGAATLTVNTTDDVQHVNTVFAGNNQEPMDIQPVLVLTDGKIGTVYCGGNAGIMRKADGLTYDFDYPNIEVGTVYAGCNNTPSDTPTADVKLNLISGIYHTVYGGNNVNGRMQQTDVVIDRAELKDLTVDTVYGGGNKAESKATKVELQNGTAATVYGGGNAATVTDSVKIQMGVPDDTGSIPGDVFVTDLYCGNNQADMKIQPEIDLKKGTITNFYAGGNAGDMLYLSTADGTGYTANYTFASEQVSITNLFGGCNQADMAGTVRLVLEGTKAENVYGGCHTSGTVPKAEILVNGNNTTNIYGGGYGEQTVVKNTDVRVQKGTVNGNVYGGSGFGQVENAKVQISDTSGDTHGRIQICGSVYGGGYGVSSVTGTTDVSVNMKLDIALKDSAEAATADLLVEEGVISKIDDGTSSGETQTSVTWKQTAVSCIDGNVYGGGDMGKVGDGMINQSSNTASITQAGSTHVKVSGGYIKGSVFGGGSGTPKAGQNYTVYMGTVFGNCETRIQGGYIEGSIYGCGYQSRVYAAEEGEKAGQAATVDIQEDEKASEIIIGTSVFGGGNKGEGSVQNASVYTVIGDTTVNISGYHQNEASVPIYFLSTGKGGVYGDGNLCLVQGTRTVNLTDFNAGTEHRDSLKTFYSLQRADTVNLVRSRIVLEGAQDLVDENADDTLYAINRVGQLNMEESSALKLTTIVNLLGGLSSDQNTETVYIDKGNNGVNNYVRRGGTVPSNRLQDGQIEVYRTEYEKYKTNSPDAQKGTYQSFNVVCVANGRYLEIKKSDSEYGNVTGLFTLELLHANPGEGGGFVYANIGAQGDTENRGSTGDFICVTKDSDAPDASSYMDVYDNVGGLKNSGGQTDYTWYYWYIKGGKYTYNAYIDGYIGTTETSFSESITLPEMNENYYYILNSVTGKEPVGDLNSSSKFCSTRLQDHWDEETDKDGDKYAIELQVVANGRNAEGNSSETVMSVGYLWYKECEWTDSDGNLQKEPRWGIQYHDGLPHNSGDVYEQNYGKFVIGTLNSGNRQQLIRQQNRFYKVETGTTGLELRFVLHKGTGVDVEIRDVPVTLTFDVLSGAADEGSGTGGASNDADSQLIVNSYTSITRLVPTQAVYLNSGRFYAGVSSDAPAKITKHSAFTAQFITKYVPSAFNTAGHTIQEKLTASFAEKYLLDPQTGIGFTITEGEDGSCTLNYVTEGNTADYTITKNGETYQVTKAGAEGYTHNLQCEGTETSSFTFPKGTVITMVAQMDEYDTTYWYYYCTEDTSEIALSKFTQMNTDASGGKKYSFSAASGGKLTDQSSNRVTEKLSFVFDFSNVPEGASAWWPGCTEAVKTIEGHLQLKHETTIGSYANVDIMDYVSEKTGTSAGEDAVTYVRAHPAVSNRYEISKEATGIEEFKVHLSDEKDTYYTRDTYGIQVEIAEDLHYINTQFDEREYAVMLELVDNTGSANPITKTKPFPEGTVFLYNGQKQVAGQDNKSVVIPVKTPGTHQIQIETGLEAFDTGDITIKASLYSSSVANYYNELKADQYTDMITFSTAENPDYALSVNANAEDAEAEMKAHEIEKGAELSLKIKGRKGGQTDPNGIASVKVYQYENGEYALKAWSDLFAETEESISLAEDEVIWNPKISKTADAGTYRLEFTYQNKTEYWDLIVR
ncbi:beta strand repeat-containing protein [Frisingicoccus sp.]|uniref:beta strand repeat-containing protein n=1 Tax=Frisingicoccus sp. TaxID=1918627 RepID=UPI003AB40CC6